MSMVLNHQGEEDMKIDNVAFNGQIWHIACPPHSMNEAKDFSQIPVKVSAELKDFINNSKFFNKLKEDKDVYVFHHNTDDLEILSLFFENEKNINKSNGEVCQISMTLPRNRKSSNNFKIFENILENNSNIKALKKTADTLFPNDKHKLVKLPNEGHGYCEFWTGKRSVDETLQKLYAVSVAEIKKLYHQFNNDILNKFS